MTFKDHRIILTGASSGIGLALAKQLAAEGARLALAARNVPALESVAESCRALGSQALVIPTDVSDQIQCRELIAQAVDAWDGIDAFFSNAGISMWTRFEDVTDLAFFETMMAVNYFGPLYLTHAALPHLKASKGKIVVVSSIAAKTGSPLHSGYAASKHALNGFFESLRTELVGTGVQITLVCPEFVRTDIRLHGFNGDGKHPASDPFDDGKAMTAEEAARIIIKVAKKGKREEIMTLLGKVGAIIRPLAPGLIDSIARRKVGLR